MQNFLNKLRIILSDPGLRKKILFVLGILLLSRLGANIPIPGIDIGRLGSFLEGNQFLGMLNIFSGGGLSNLSIMMLGVGPYITGSIIMQLLTMIFPALKEMYQENGEAGRQKFNQYSRLLTVPLAALQGFALLTLLEKSGVLLQMTMFNRVVDVVIIIAGSVLLMWLGELITEYGIGNGVSLLIFAGIVSSLPRTVQQVFLTYDPSKLPMILGFIVVAFIIIAGVVVVSEAERMVSVSYAKQVRGMKMYGGFSTHLPLKVNQAGVIPIIFALSILMFPQMIAGALGYLNSDVARSVAKFLTTSIENAWVYGISYFVLVFLFTYFYTAVTFDPHAISSNLQKSGAFIPGIRPGKPTADHLGNIITRITLFGALFLGVIAVLPLILKAITNVQALAIGGTSLLIVVSVVLETMKQVEGQIVMREYE